jgi:hypothetical protein
MSKLSKTERPKRYGKFRQAILQAEHNRRKKKNPTYGRPKEKQLPNFIKEKVNESVYQRGILSAPIKYINTV